MIRALLLLIALATSAVAQTTSLHCPSGCLPNVGGPDTGMNGYQKPRTCSCNWDTPIQANIDQENSILVPALGGAFPVVPDFSGATNTGTDNAPVINAAIAYACNVGATTGRPPEVRLPPGRIGIGSTIGLLCNGLKITGAGKQTGTSLDQIPVASGCGHGFPMIRNLKSPARVCATSGAGSCDAAINTAARGQNCPCYSNGDCQSNSCTGGVGLNGVTIRDLAVTIKSDCSFGIDLMGLSNSLVDNVSVSAAGPFSSGINTIDVLFSDGFNTVAGYSNVLSNGNFTGGADASNIIVDIQPSGNDSRIFNNVITGSGGRLIKCEKVGVKISNSLRIAMNDLERGGGSVDPPFSFEDHCAAGIFQGNRVEMTNGAGQVNLTSDSSDEAISSDNFFENVPSPHIVNNGTRTTCGGLPCGTVAANACATSNPGIRYWDTNISNSATDHGGMSCFCNGQATPRYCRDDTGACGSTTTDCG